VRTLHGVITPVRSKVHQFGPALTREGAAESPLNGEDGHSVRYEKTSSSEGLGDWLQQVIDSVMSEIHLDQLLGPGRAILWLQGVASGNPRLGSR
jgi:hypothetical protein